MLYLLSPYIRLFLLLLAPASFAFNADTSSIPTLQSTYEVALFDMGSRTWGTKLYADVRTGQEFIYHRQLFVKTKSADGVESKNLDIDKVFMSAGGFNPAIATNPKADDVVYLEKSTVGQSQGHWLLRDIIPEAQVVFQGQMFEVKRRGNRLILKNTGKVLSAVAAVHQQKHHQDIFGLSVHFTGSGKQDRIIGSKAHPFYVLGKGYINLADLEPGMRLKTDDGTVATVIASAQYFSEPRVLYNLTVDNTANYYIQSKAIQTQVLVHNCWKTLVGQTVLRQYLIKHGGSEGLGMLYRGIRTQNFYQAVQKILTEKIFFQRTLFQENPGVEPEAFFSEMMVRHKNQPHVALHSMGGYPQAEAHALWGARGIWKPPSHQALIVEINPNLLQAVMDIGDEHVTDDIPVSAITRIIGVSPTHPEIDGLVIDLVSPDHVDIDIILEMMM